MGGGALKRKRLHNKLVEWRLLSCNSLEQMARRWHSDRVCYSSSARASSRLSWRQGHDDDRYATLGHIFFCFRTVFFIQGKEWSGKYDFVQRPRSLSVGSMIRRKKSYNTEIAFCTVFRGRGAGGGSARGGGQYTAGACLVMTYICVPFD